MGNCTLTEPNGNLQLIAALQKLLCLIYLCFKVVGIDCRKHPDFLDGNHFLILFCFLFPLLLFKAILAVVHNPAVREIFENGKVFFATLGYASDVTVQVDKAGIGEDAVSAVIHKATIYMPFAELVDIEKEIERLKKEEERLTKELARSNGMLNNERFISKAPQAKIDEEKAKLTKYTEMMAQVKERLAQLAK